MRKARYAIAIFLLIAAAALVLARPYFRGAAFVVQAAGIDGAAAAATHWYATRVTPTDVPPIAWRRGTLRARAYRPEHRTGRPIMLVPGVHAAGIDERRLAGFARDIAG